MARPGRPPRQWSDTPADGSAPTTDPVATADVDPVEPVTSALVDRLQHRPGDSAPARAALDAIAQALQDLKARTASVAQHLGPDHADVIETIKTL